MCKRYGDIFGPFRDDKTDGQFRVGYSLREIATTAARSLSSTYKAKGEAVRAKFLPSSATELQKVFVDEELFMVIINHLCMGSLFWFELSGFHAHTACVEASWSLDRLTPFSIAMEAPTQCPSALASCGASGESQMSVLQDELQHKAFRELRTGEMSGEKVSQLMGQLAQLRQEKNIAERNKILKGQLAEIQQNKEVLAQQEQEKSAERQGS